MYTDEHGNTWWKGNLHTHTTRSDGRATPEECAALYRSHGYDFLALTDHWQVSENGTSDGLLLLSGCEYDFGSRVKDGIYHIVAVGCLRDPGVVRADGPQTAIDKIHAAGGLADLAHPAWSMNTLAHLMPLAGVDYTEIFNSVSDLPANCRPYSGMIVDLLAAQGIFWKSAAVDDTHWYREDACRAFIWVKAETCTREAILAAIRAWDFYASEGPHAEVALDREKNCVRVRCPAEDHIASVVFFTDTAWTGRRSTVGTDLTEAVFPLTGRETFVRAELRDAEGRSAWMQTTRIKNDE
ncbi:MAG: hypothetical protein IK132_01295 [Clostridia bacterium]|nr:hypothetical protein [Clostridia bacterium]